MFAAARAPDEVLQRADPTVKPVPTRIPNHLACQIDFPRTIDRHHPLIARDPTWIIHPSARVQFEIWISVHELIEPPAAQHMAGDNLTWQIAFHRVIHRTAAHQFHQRIIKHAGMNPEMAVFPQSPDNGFRTIAQTRLNRRAVLYKLSSITADPLMPLIENPPLSFWQDRGMLDEPGDLVSGNQCVAASPWHLRIDLGNHCPSALHCRLDHIHTHSERAPAACVWRTHLDQRHVQRQRSIFEKRGHLGHRARRVVRLATLHRLAQRWS